MNFSNIDYLLSQVKGITDVKEAGKKALLALEKRDPSTARMLCAMIYNKQNPANAIKQFSDSGRINLKQVDKIRAGYNMLKKLGLKLNIPDTTWVELQQIASSTKDLIVPKNTKGF